MLTTLLTYAGGIAGLIAAALSVYFAKSDKTKKDIENLREIIEILKMERSEDKQEISEMKLEIKKNAMYIQAINNAYKCQRTDNPKQECIVLKYILENQ